MATLLWLAYITGLVTQFAAGAVHVYHHASTPEERTNGARAALLCPVWPVTCLYWLTKIITHMAHQAKGNQ